MVNRKTPSHNWLTNAAVPWKSGASAPRKAPANGASAPVVALFQNRNLSRMIELMLRHSVQQMVEIVFLPWNPLAQPGLRQSRNRPHQYIVRVLHLRDSLAPRRLGSLGNGRKIVSPFRLAYLPGYPSASGTIPRSNMQYKLPNAVNVRQRLSRGRCSINIIEQLKQCRTMPGIALKSAAKLVGDQRGLGALRGHIYNFAAESAFVNMFTHTRYACIIIEMIVSFGDKTPEDIFHGHDTKAARKIARALWTRVQVKLDLLNASTTLEDLRVPPSNRLEKLHGNLAGFYSLRVNDQYRLVFRFVDGNALDVRCTDYH
jgi:proteic killer suppression protein